MEDNVKQFLIVDENVKNAMFWEVVISQEFPDVKIKICKTGFEAEDACKQTKFAFIASSWELEPMSGLVFMQKARAIQRNKHTPFLIFSQVLQESDLALAGEFGISNYILKPFDKPKVIDRIKAMLDEEEKLDNTQKSLRKIEDWIADNKVSEALKIIGDCLKKGPHAARAYTLNGHIWARTDHPDKAEASYREALKFDPNYTHATNGLGKLLMKLKRFDEAIPMLEAMTQKVPMNLERTITLGHAYLGNGQEDKAEACFNEVKNADSESAVAADGLGKVNFARGNLDLAAKFFKESGKGDELAAYFNNMGIAMVNQGKFDDAIKLYKNAIGVMPDKAKVHLLEFNVGLAYKKQNKFAEAAEAFAQAYLSNPQYDKSYQAMGICVKESQAKKLPLNKNLIQEVLNKRKELTAAAAGNSGAATAA